MNNFVAHTVLPLAAEQPSATLKLQQCGSCQAVNYPARDLCGECLADELSWQPQSGLGRLLAVSTLHYSLEPALHSELPITIGSIKLAAGPVVIAYLQQTEVTIGDSLEVSIGRDSSANAVLIATPYPSTSKEF
ncbi:MAG: Zn-ribbon domain-containing OB-fold protein [Porticoccaceae bacterium]